LLFDILVPSLVGTREVKEGSGYGQEISDKAMVEVDEAYESLYVSLVLQGGPIADSSDFN